MDLYVSVKKQKIAGLLGRNSVVQTLRTILDNCETICVYGNSGVGKTHLVKSVLSGEKYTEIDLSNPPDYDRMKYSTSHVLIDDVDVTTQAWKDVASRGKLTEGGMIVVTMGVKGVDFCDCIKLEALSSDEQLKLIKERSPDTPNDIATKAIERANGNLRNLFDYAQDSDDKDIFKSPKDFIHDLLSGVENPSSHIGSVIQEHGYSCGIVHENYLNTKDPDILGITENLSTADVCDRWIYDSNWELLPYYCNHGIIAPTILMGSTLMRESIRPGSAWTKFNNRKMRQSKIRAMKDRTHLPIDVDGLMMIHKYCITDPDKAIEVLLSYNMKPQDLDVINHLSSINKIKPKALQLLKKRLKDALG